MQQFWTHPSDSIGFITTPCPESKDVSYWLPSHVIWDEFAFMHCTKQAVKDLIRYCDTYLALMHVNKVSSSETVVWFTSLPRFVSIT